MRRTLPALVALTSLLTAGLISAPAAAAPTARAAATPSFNGTVWAVAFRGDVVYVGGSFTSVTFRGRTVARKRLAAFSARTGQVLSWRPAADGTVRSLAVAGTSIYAAGDFGSVSGRKRDAVARLSAGSGAVAAFSHRFGGDVGALAVRNGRVYAGGRFSSVDGVRRGNLAAFSLTTGRLDRAWRPTTDDKVRALVATRARVYVGGTFHKLNGNRGVTRLGAVHATSGGLIRRFRPKAPAMVTDVAVDRAGVYSATGGPGGRAVGYSPTGRVRWTHLFDGDVHNLAVLGGVTYVGGHFDRACSTTSTIVQLGCPAGYRPRTKLAALDSRGRLTSWNPRANSAAGVHVLTADPARGRIAAGGVFTRVGGVSRGRFALFG